MNFLLNHLTEIFAVAWILTSARQILFWLYVLQLKQYRLDRLWLAVKERSFARLLASPFRIGVTAFFLMWALCLRVLAINARVFSALYVSVVVFYVIFAVYQLWLTSRQAIKFPKLTPKITLLFCFVLAAEAALLTMVYRFWPEQVLAIDVLQPFIVFAFFALLQLPNLWLLARRKNAATTKRERMRQLTVIGITGSYGKTGTKEYLSHILSRKFKVLKTPEHMNVDTGIAGLILRELTETHQVFVVEMGAYKKGEIKAICDIVKPQFAVMTALSNQHLELFGSQEAIEDAKFELVSAVGDQNHIFANADSELLRSAFERRSIEPHWYGLRNGQARPEQLASASGRTAFTYKGQRFETDIFSSGALTNLMAAITVAEAMGMTLSTIAEAIKTLPVLNRTMEVVQGRNGAVFIDSSYNASTAGVRAALSDLELFTGYTKLVVFKEVIELGKDTDHDHELIAKDLAKHANEIVLLDSAQRTRMSNTLLAQGFAAAHIYSQATADSLISRIDNKTVVMFMGRGSESVLKRWRT